MEIYTYIEYILQILKFNLKIYYSEVKMKEELILILENLYFKYGNTEEVISLSIIVDEFIIIEQKQKMKEMNKQ